MKKTFSLFLTIVAAISALILSSCTQDEPVTVTYISLEPSSVTLEKGECIQLSITVLPSNADNASVLWSSSDESVAMVSPEGMLTAMGYGMAEIHCTAQDGSAKQATCTVIVGKPTTGEANGHTWVDLGLPSGTLWATSNVGADVPGEYGDYFAWGETTPKAEFNFENYKYYDNATKRYTKYYFNSNDGTGDNKTRLDVEDDAARANWGERWSMPSFEQMKELIKYCTRQWSCQDGNIGTLFTSEKNGKTIFLPAAGERRYYEFNGIASEGCYMISEFFNNGPNSVIRFFKEDYDGYGGRPFGYSVRPVCMPEE